MSTSTTSFEEAARRVEAELRRLVTTVNDEVVPAIRKDGGLALRKLSAQLAKLADSLDLHSRP